MRYTATLRSEVAQDGTMFTVVYATYKYKDMEGNVLASDPTNIDGHKVYALLNPIVTRFSHKALFTIVNQPLTEGGNPDLSKNHEILKPVVIVNISD